MSKLEQMRTQIAACLVKFNNVHAKADDIVENGVPRR